MLDLLDVDYGAVVPQRLVQRCDESGTAVFDRTEIDDPYLSAVLGLSSLV